MKIEVVMESVLNGVLGEISSDELTSRIYENLKLEEKNHSLNIDLKTARIVCDIVKSMRNQKDINCYTKFDDNFNMIVAGLMGSTCYMKDNFEKLHSRTKEQILRIANTVLVNGHHSTFGHAHLTLQISNIPKSLAMVINNEKEYNTSEKSARYTIMHDIPPQNSELYEKWIEIFNKIITEKYANIKAPMFFDEKGTKIKKLSQENARYLIPVSTPTNMVYTTSFRQLNYLCHMFEQEISNPSNQFYKDLTMDMADFVSQIKKLNLYIPELQDNKDRKLSLFGDDIAEDYFSNVYQTKYPMSFACLAQSQRHRTINYNIVNETYIKDKLRCYIPPIINDKNSIKNEYIRDFLSVKDSVPQGSLVECVERGNIENFVLKAKERLCSQAQKEVRDCTLSTAKKYKSALEDTKDRFKTIASSEYIKREVRATSQKQVSLTEKLIEEITPYTQGARCTSGYNCASPCGFKEGIELESLI